MTAQDIQVGICIADLHFPNHNQKLWENILRIIDDIKPSYFVFLGDQLDMDAVNHWDIEQGNKRGMEGKRLRKTYDDFNSQIMDQLNLSLPDYCRKIFLLGNHCNFIEKYIDKIPELEGFAEVRRNVHLDNWEVIDNKGFAKIGKMYFTHGDILKNGKFHTDKMVQVSERNIFYGHFHTLQSFVKVNSFDCEPHMAMCIPCACDKNPDYMKNKPSAWVNGFGVFYIMPNGNFNIYPVISSKDHFIFNGKYY